MDFYRYLFITKEKEKRISFLSIYILSLLFVVQSSLVAYVGSSYLENFTNEKYIGLIFAFGYLGSILLNLSATKILKKIGNSKFLLSISVLMTFLLFITGLGVPYLTIPAFILYLMTFPQVYLSIDIFLETLIGEDEYLTGGKRGITLTVMATATFLTTALMGFIAGPEGDLAKVFLYAAGFGLFLIMYVIVFFRHFLDPVYKVLIPREFFKLTISKDVKIVLYINFLLQLFYSWAVIYIPKYLATEIGLPWDEISKILAAGLFAFVILEYPVGRIADLYLGEKEFMATGITILALSTAAITFFDTTSISSWMILLFTTRIGASLVEATTESYFFKKVSNTDMELISLFRLNLPVAYLFGSILGSIVLVTFSFNNIPENFMFIILGVILTTGIFATSRLADTK